MSHQVFLQQVLLSKPFASSIIPTQLWNSSGDLGCLLILASFFAMVFVEVKRGLFYRIFFRCLELQLRGSKGHRLKSNWITWYFMFTYVRWKKLSKKSDLNPSMYSSRNTPQGLLKVRSPIPQIPCNQINQVHRSGIREVYGLLGSVLWIFSLGRSSWKSFTLLFAVGLFLQFVCVCVFAVYLDKLGVCPNKLQMCTNCKFTLLTETQSHNTSCGWDIALSEPPIPWKPWFGSAKSWRMSLDWLAFAVTHKTSAECIENDDLAAFCRT